MAKVDRDSVLTGVHGEDGHQPPKRAARVALLPLLAAGSFLAGQIAKDNGIDITNASIPWWVSPSTEVAQLKPPEGIEEQVLLINRYLGYKDFLSDILGTRFSISNARFSDSRPAVDFVQAHARQFLVDGAYLSRLVLPVDEALSIYLSGDNVVIEGVSYKIDDTFERSIALAVLETKMKRVKVGIESDQRKKEVDNRVENLRGLGGTSPEMLYAFDYEELARNQSKIAAESERDARLLLQLKERKADIKVDRGAFAVMDPSYLITLEKTFQILEESGLPIPSHTRFVRFDKNKKTKDGGQYYAWYQPHWYPLDPYAVYITNYTQPDSLAHEAGHFLADAWHIPEWRGRMELFSQEEFNRFVWNGVETDDKEEISNRKEVYADGFKDFIMRGDESRRRVALAPVDEEQAKTYEFMKRMLGGEFKGFGEKIRVNTNYQPGARIYIKDSDRTNPGFLLRPAATTQLSGLNPELPAVFDRDVVELLERKVVSPGARGPFDVMWRVRIIEQDWDSTLKLGDIRGATGWIIEDSLGFNADTSGSAH